LARFVKAVWKLGRDEWDVMDERDAVGLGIEGSFGEAPNGTREARVLPRDSKSSADFSLSNCEAGRLGRARRRRRHRSGR